MSLTFRALGYWLTGLMASVSTCSVLPLSQGRAERLDPVTSSVSTTTSHSPWGNSAQGWTVTSDHTDLSCGAGTPPRGWLTPRLFSIRFWEKPSHPQLPKDLPSCRWTPKNGHSSVLELSGAGGGFLRILLNTYLPGLKLACAAFRSSQPPLSLNHASYFFYLTGFVWD